MENALLTCNHLAEEERAGCFTLIVFLLSSGCLFPTVPICIDLDWLLSLKQFFINVPYHILVASLTLMALF